MRPGASWQPRLREGGGAASGELTPILVGQALNQFTISRTTAYLRDRNVLVDASLRNYDFTIHC